MRAYDACVMMAAGRMQSHRHTFNWSCPGDRGGRKRERDPACRSMDEGTIEPARAQEPVWQAKLRRAERALRAAPGQALAAVGGAMTAAGGCSVDPPQHLGGLGGGAARNWPGPSSSLSDPQRPFFFLGGAAVVHTGARGACVCVPAAFQQRSSTRDWPICCAGPGPRLHGCPPPKQHRRPGPHASLQCQQCLSCGAKTSYCVHSLTGQHAEGPNSSPPTNWPAPGTTVSPSSIARLDYVRAVRLKSGQVNFHTGARATSGTTLVADVRL